jgi:hypothetical protein
MLLLTKIAAAVAVLSTLVSISKICSPLRKRLPELNGLFYCPICLSFWFALPVIVTHGMLDYLVVVAIASLWMLGIAKLYVELDIMNGD